VARFLVKCDSCGQTNEKAYGGNRACPNCGSSAIKTMCAGCGEEIRDDMKESNSGLLVHNNIRCWNACNDKY
jgi:predicted RNA-binding Zn-ribbon protein involved in translation (DUF1610 family)